MELIVLIIIAVEILVWPLIMLLISRNKKDVTASDKRRLFQVEYSERVLTLARDITIQACVLQFNSFKDSHELDKINRTHIQKLVTGIAKEINELVVLDNLDYGNLLYKKEFIERYIINISINTTKELLDKAIDKYNE